MLIIGNFGSYMVENWWIAMRYFNIRNGFQWLYGDWVQWMNKKIFRLLMEKYNNTIVDNENNLNSALNNCTTESIKGNVKEIVKNPTSIWGRMLEKLNCYVDITTFCFTLSIALDKKQLYP